MPTARHESVDNPPADVRREPVPEPCGTRVPRVPVSVAHRRWRFSLAALFLLTSVSAGILATYRFYRIPYWQAQARQKYQEELARRLARRVAQLPGSLGSWQGEDLPGREVPFDTQPLAGWLWRQYRHHDTGQEIEVAIVVGPAHLAQELPLSLGRPRGRPLLFNAPSSVQSLEVNDSSIDTQAANVIQVRGGTKLEMRFLRWAHWTNGWWCVPRRGEEYLQPDDTLLQVGLVYYRGTLEKSQFRPSELSLEWPEEREFAQHLFEYLQSNVVDRNRPVAENRGPR